MAKVLVAAIAPLFYPHAEGSTGRFDRGEKFQMNEEDVQRYVDSKLVVQMTLTEAQKAEAEAPAQVDLVHSTLDQLMKTWDVDMSPVQYLEKFPEGPHSDLALRIVELEAEQAEGK